jgi:hypothetical protein
MESCKSKVSRKVNLRREKSQDEEAKLSERMKHEELAYHELVYSGLLGHIILT